ncbi:hypothetical protein ColTof4_06390 [Colletotrichum tofieldiae]|nr:hypothetical protein ColTof3_01580 [Colletotrichum tofieldiae]GKT73967.1 hypothetical protein ColTof4_06390 [Colletotrichum tofieldiae]GKT95942.1 hypothetical protein Ct61P_13792 [Colletotrichum tofieldiae]
MSLPEALEGNIGILLSEAATLPDGCTPNLFSDLCRGQGACRDLGADSSTQDKDKCGLAAELMLLAPAEWGRFQMLRGDGKSSKASKPIEGPKSSEFGLVPKFNYIDRT